MVEIFFDITEEENIFMEQNDEITKLIIKL